MVNQGEVWQGSCIGGAKQIIGGSDANNFASSVAGAQWIPITGRQANVGTENNTKLALPIPGTFRNPFIYVTTNASTTNVAITLRDAGVSTALAITVTALTTGTFSNLVNFYVAASAALLNWQVQQATTGNIIGNGLIVEFDVT